MAEMFVVQAQTGEYDFVDKWVVAVFNHEDHARHHVKLCQMMADIIHKHMSEHLFPDGGKETPVVTRLKLSDPKFKMDGTCEYGTHYWYDPVLVLDSEVQ